MPANAESMLYTGKSPYEGLGTKLDKQIGSSEEAIVGAGLDWEVEVAKIVTQDEKATAIEKWRVTRRKSDDLILGVVKPGWKPIQNRTAFQFFDSIVNQGDDVGGEGGVKYDTAGYFMGGSKVFILAKLPGVIQVGYGIGSTDDVEKFLLLANNHYGSAPLEVLFTPVRVVCQNTLALALHRKIGEDDWAKDAPRIKIQHTDTAPTMLAQASRTMGKALKYYERFGEFSNYLYNKQLSSKQVCDIVAQIFPANKKKEVTITTAYNRSEVERLFVEGKGHSAIAGSAWALMNAVGEFADHSFSHKKGMSLEKHSFSVVFGGARSLKQRAEKIIVESIAA